MSTWTLSTLTSNPDEEAVRSFGAEMFDSLFQGDLRAMYYESKRTAFGEGKGMRLKLRIVAGPGGAAVGVSVRRT